MFKLIPMLFLCFLLVGCGESNTAKERKIDAATAQLLEDVLVPKCLSLEYSFHTLPLSIEGIEMYAVQSATSDNLYEHFFEELSNLQPPIKITDLPPSVEELIIDYKYALTSAARTREILYISSTSDTSTMDEQQYEFIISKMADHLHNAKTLRHQLETLLKAAQ